MSTDVVLDDRDGTWLTLRGVAVHVAASDIMLDQPARRGTSGGSFRRALVHDANDGLTVNFNGDYPGGVRINGASINLKALQLQGEEVKLPTIAACGDLLLVQNSLPAVMHGGVLVRDASERFSLWICIGHMPIGGAVLWQAIPLGETVVGSS